MKKKKYYLISLLILKIIIVKNKILSNNRNINIKINGKKNNFYEYKSEIVYLPYNENSIKIDYELEDKNAKAEILGNENLKSGKNEVIVKVIAENGEEQNYFILVEKEQNSNDFLHSIFSLGFLAIIIYLIYKIIKKKKNNKKLY